MVAIRQTNPASSSTILFYNDKYHKKLVMAIKT